MRRSGSSSIRRAGCTSRRESTEMTASTDTSSAPAMSAATRTKHYPFLEEALSDAVVAGVELHGNGGQWLTCVVALNSEFNLLLGQRATTKLDPFFAEQPEDAGFG